MATATQKKVKTGEYGGRYVDWADLGEQFRADAATVKGCGLTVSEINTMSKRSGSSFRVRLAKHLGNKALKAVLVVDKYTGVLHLTPDGLRVVKAWERLVEFHCRSLQWSTLRGMDRAKAGQFTHNPERPALSALPIKYGWWTDGKAAFMITPAETDRLIERSGVPRARLAAMTAPNLEMILARPVDMMLKGLCVPVSLAAWRGDYHDYRCSEYLLQGADGRRVAVDAKYYLQAAKLGSAVRFHAGPMEYDKRGNHVTSPVVVTRGPIGNGSGVIGLIMPLRSDCCGDIITERG